MTKTLQKKLRNHRYLRMGLVAKMLKKGTWRDRETEEGKYQYFADNGKSLNRTRLAIYDKLQSQTTKRYERKTPKIPKMQGKKP